MTDQEWIDVINNIDCPRKLLAEIVKSEHVLGYDPYYADLRRALLNSAERLSNDQYGGGCV